jgi:glycosyltransferase involved in cell wall biosynthesis
MHIALLCDPASFHTQKWANGLRNGGASVTVFSFSEARLDNIPCVRISPRFAPGGKLTYASFLYSGDRLHDALKAHRVDILNPVNMTPYGVWAARSGFKPIAGITMGADILEYPPDHRASPLQGNRSWSNVEGRNTLLRKFRNRFARHFFRHHVKNALDACSFITGDNLVLVKAVRDWFGIPADKIHLNRWGIEPERFFVPEDRLELLRRKFNIRKGQTVVLSPRGVKAIYQGDIILQAFERLLDEGRPNVKFIMLSAGYEIPAAIEAHAKQLEKRFENFHFHRGLIPRTELIDLWPLVDIFISAPVYDGYSNAVSEGRFIGAIPVVNAIPGNLELIRHGVNGWVVNPFAPEKLAKALGGILADPDIWKERFRAANREWIETHSLLDANIKAFLDLCRKETGS